MQTELLTIQQQGHLGVMTLNRPSHLNALSLEMIQGIQQQLQLWQQDASVQAVVFKSDHAKAFCAGGDIRYLYDAYQSQSTDYRQYFVEEYAMLSQMRNYAKPIIVLMDGYVLGGGMGLAQAGHILVSSEKSRFAMPETAIGFFPDVGATHFLSRLDDIGVYLAVTGEQISSDDALYLDLIDYLVPSQQFNALLQALATLPELNQAIIQQVIARYIVASEPSGLQNIHALIQQHFSHASMAQIEASLAAETHPQCQDWAAHVLKLLQQRSTVAKQTSLKLQHVGRGLSLAQCLQLERDLQDIWFEHGDLMEGVRALLIDKDKQPKWQSHNEQLTQMVEQLTTTA